MGAAPEPGPGIWQSLRNLLRTLLAIAGNRAELLGVELREEAARWIGAFLLAAALVALGTLTLALITLTIVVACWDEHRLAALITLSLVYLAGTIVAALGLRWRLQRWPSLSATVAELKKDKAWLEKKI